MNNDRRKTQKAVIHSIQTMKGLANTAQKQIEEIYDGENDLLDALEDWSGTKRYQTIDNNVDLLQSLVEEANDLVDLLEHMLEELREIA